MTYAEDHRKHMQHEIEKQDAEWRALNRRINTRRENERIAFLIGMLLIAIAYGLILWLIK